MVKLIQISYTGLVGGEEPTHSGEGEQLPTRSKQVDYHQRTGPWIASAADPKPGRAQAARLLPVRDAILLPTPLIDDHGRAIRPLPPGTAK
jgi:hypothetical protein